LHKRDKKESEMNKKKKMLLKWRATIKETYPTDSMAVVPDKIMRSKKEEFID